MKSKYSENHSFSTNWNEIGHIAVALVVLAFAFSLVLAAIHLNTSPLSVFLNYKIEFFINSVIAVGFAFVLHELGHKYVAQHKGLWAEFRIWPAGLLIALGSAFLGFVFAAPGATMISPAHKTKFGYAVQMLSKEDIGHIGIAGVIINLILGSVFGLLAAIGGPVLGGLSVFGIAAQINAWLAVFNLIPFGPLDGKKVMLWSKKIWLGTLALGGLLLISTYYLVQI